MLSPEVLKMLLVVDLLDFVDLLAVSQTKKLLTVVAFVYQVCELFYFWQFGLNQQTQPISRQGLILLNFPFCHFRHPFVVEDLLELFKTFVLCIALRTDIVLTVTALQMVN